MASLTVDPKTTMACICLLFFELNFKFFALSCRPDDFLQRAKAFAVSHGRGDVQVLINRIKPTSNSVGSTNGNGSTPSDQADPMISSEATENDSESNDTQQKRSKSRESTTDSTHRSKAKRTIDQPKRGTRLAKKLAKENIASSFIKRTT